MLKVVRTLLTTMLPVVMLPDTITVVAVALVKPPSRARTVPVDTSPREITLPAVTSPRYAPEPVADVNWMSVTVALVAEREPAETFVDRTLPTVKPPVNRRSPPVPLVNTVFEADTLVAVRCVVEIELEETPPEVKFVKTAFPMVPEVKLKLEPVTLAANTLVLVTFVADILGALTAPVIRMFPAVKVVVLTLVTVAEVITALVDVIEVAVTDPDVKLVMAKLIPVAELNTKVPVVRELESIFELVSAVVFRVPVVTFVDATFPMVPLVAVTLPAVIPLAITLDAVSVVKDPEFAEILPPVAVCVTIKELTVMFVSDKFATVMFTVVTLASTFKSPEMYTLPADTVEMLADVAITAPAVMLVAFAFVVTMEPALKAPITRAFPFTSIPAVGAVVFIPKFPRV